MEQPLGLICVLLDPDAAVAEQDDAAMDLARFDEPEALDALLRVGRTANESETLLASLGESIAEILLRGGRSWCPGVDELAPTARQAFEARLDANGN